MTDKRTKKGGIKNLKGINKYMTIRGRRSGGHGPKTGRKAIEKEEK
jgi:hypothetical protein